MTIEAFFLLVIYQLKHFIADYPLQNEYMLGKFKEKGWILPLAAHSGTHAFFTFCISFYFVGIYNSVVLGLLDFVVHFSMDRIKASPKMLGKYSCISKKEFIEGVTEEQKRDNVKFWWSLGLDQGIHHLTHYVIIGVLLNGN